MIFLFFEDLVEVHFFDFSCLEVVMSFFTHAPEMRTNHAQYGLNRLLN